MGSNQRQPSSQIILELNAEEVRDYFLKSENYCGLSMPQYIDFTDLLADINKILSGKNLKDFFGQGKKPNKYDKNNDDIVYNKNGSLMK
ncbi:hypothetical protein PT286_00430 [Neisseriaceae bacterium ESL0693]|nr:hypothetical protein [Neisseriaceae bacterium ESL0693]